MSIRSRRRFCSSKPSMLRVKKRIALVAMCVVSAACVGQPHGTPTRVIIPRGASFGQATDSLARGGLVGWPKTFRLYGRLTGGDRNIKPGTYLLKHGTPWNAIIGALNGGHGLVNTVTIPEGYTIAQITPLLAKTLKVPTDSVTAAVSDTALLARLDVPNKTLEGYLFPDTYAFPVGTTARQAVREMVYSFERRWRPDWDSSVADLKINRNDLVTMASIVEREARLPEERPVIAAVYYNRLKRGMLLQADPTVQYALGHHVGRVLYKDLTIDSPYNTYVHKGLPPGPVASPGVASLAAAANPANVPYLYFVATRDGHHEFRMTLEQHTDAVREVRATMPKRPPTRMLAMATPSSASKSASASAKTAPRATSKSSRTTSKAPAKTAKSSSAKTSAKTPAKSTTKKTSTTAKKRTSGTTSTGR
ncbi:MAG: endolytic transglycosylase MltG [Gemmatimonadetes bacterium]|nr:MAG: endolytic transglycosylase MltG [Gemmatimonadota bacterium]PYO78178.1 MAG: endolytic transglycosylase MltG [Gemmatimonadota bacterium]